jgi:hypothetical protein
MKRVSGLGIGGLRALVVGLVLPFLPDSAFATRSGQTSFRGSAASCIQFLHPVRAFGVVLTTPSELARDAAISRSCATASDVMNLGAWLVVLGALALAIAVVVLALSRIRRPPALSAP